MVCCLKIQMQQTGGRPIRRLERVFLKNQIEGFYFLIQVQQMGAFFVNSDVVEWKRFSK